MKLNFLGANNPWMRFFGVEWHLNEIFWCWTKLKQYFLMLNEIFGAIPFLDEIFFAQTLLQQDKVIKLCLGSFHSSNLIHFQLEHRNSNSSSMIFEQSKKKIEWSRLAEIFNLTHAWLVQVDVKVHFHSTN